MIDTILRLFEKCFSTTGTFLTKGLNEFAPDVNTIMEQISGSLQAIGYAMLIILTLWNIVKTTTSFVELKRPEVFGKVFIRFILTKYVIGYGWTLVNQLFGLFASITESIFNSSGIAINGAWSISYPNVDTSWFSQILDTVSRIINPLGSIPGMILSVLAFIVALVVVVTVLLTVMGRFFKIYLFAALAPLPMACFGSESTNDIGRSYIRGFLSVCAEGLIIGLAMIVFAAYLSMPISHMFESEEIFQWLPSGVEDMMYCFSTIFNMLLFLGIVKSSDSVVQRIFGV